MNANPESNPAETVIEMIDATISSARDTAVSEIEHINWQVKAGDFWVIGGWHGAGKSDFISTAAGLQQPSRGQVRIFGHEAAALKEHDLVAERKRIALVYENGGRIFPQLTVSENVALPLRYHNNWTAEEAGAGAEKVLEWTGLKSLATNRPGNLSPSWQQRVGLARALALQPEILLLDKPLLGIDLRHRRWWFDFLKNLSAGSPWNGSPVTLAVTTDDLHPWVEQARQFAVIRENQLLLLGGTDDLKTSHEAIMRELLADDFITG